MPSARKRIPKLVQEAVTKRSETELNEPQQNLLRLCRLLVDIQYRRKYELDLDKEAVSEYSEVTI